MSRQSAFFVLQKVMLGLPGSINLGICTAFLLSKPVTFLELSVIYSLILGTSLVLDYPTGNLADRFGRKRVYAFGVLATALQYASYASFSSPTWLYFGAVVGGIGDALISGSLEAWLVDEEKRRSATDLHYVFGISRSAASAVSILGNLVVGVLLGTNLALAYWGSAGLLAWAAVVALVFFPDNRGSRSRTLDLTMGGVKVFLRSAPLIFLACILAVAFASYSVFILYWQPRLESLGVAPNRLPLLNSIYLVGSALSGYLYAKQARRLGSEKFLYGAFTAMTGGIALMMAEGVGPGMLGLFAYGLGYGSVIPLFFDWAADFIPADLRASLLSLMNAIAGFVAVITTAAIGKMIQIWGLTTAAWVGVALGGCILISLGLVRRMAARWEAARRSAACGSSIMGPGF